MEKYRVLIVDDEPFILKSLTRLFRDQHIELLTASSGEQALEIIKETPVQVLLTDNLMPGMTGVELLQKVKDIAPDTIRIVLSGQSEMDAVVKAVNEGEAFRFILKPWNDLDLKVTINLAMAHYKLTQDNKELIRELKEKGELLGVLRSKHPDLYDSLLQELGLEPTVADEQNQPV